jgi:glycerol-3-phosphate dehydrogenase (NAD(P)+)
VQKIGIIGGGAWGTALAAVARVAGRETVIWAREAEVVAAINDEHRNTIYLPDVELDPGIRATGELAEAGAAEAVLFVVPAQHARVVAAELVAHLEPGVPVVICSKGIEVESGALMSEVLAEVLPETPLAVLSGPTFAIEVAQGLPTAVTLACVDEDLGGRLVTALGSTNFRPYLADDMVGAQVGGAVKNVLAIACGIVEGRELGDNARAALITRGIAEIVRLGIAKGARSETLMGLSGLGDLVLTCNSDLSRNMSLGILLGEGMQLVDILESRTSVAEGVATADAVTLLARRLGIEMPICTAVDGIVNHFAGIDAAIKTLLARPFRPETG